MNTNDQNDNSKPRRRHGRWAEELAKLTDCSLYTAKQAIKIQKHAPELQDYIIHGELRPRQAIAIMKYAPELIAYVVDGRLPCAEVNRVIRELRQLEEPELTFEETVEASFRKWLSSWAKEDRREVREIVDEMLYGGAIAELIPSQEAENLGVEIDPGTNQTENPKETSK